MDLPKKSGSLGLGGSSGSSSLNSIPIFSPRFLTEDVGPSWRNFSRDITSNLACSWFNLEIPEELATVISALDDSSTIKPLGISKPLSSLRRSWGDFGEPQTLSKSPLAKKILDYLSSRVTTSFTHALTQIGPSLFINLNDLAGDGSTAVENDQTHTWSGPWGTEFGSRVMVSLQVFNNEEGLETAVWFIDGIVGTRARKKSDEGEVTKDDVDFRDKILPAFARDILYLAETPLPSSIFGSSRNIAYAGLDERFWPQPFYAIEDFRLVGSPLIDESGEPVLNFHIFPQVIVLGWLITETDNQAIEMQVSSVIDSLVHASSILEDGFRNYQSDEIPAEWPSYFGKVSSNDLGWQRAQTTRWVPNTQVGALVHKSASEYFEARKTDNSEKLRDVAEYGAGSQVSDAINTLAFSELIPNEKFEEAIAYLNTAISLEHADQSTNALCNLGLVYMAMGNEIEGERVLLAALERVDKFAEGEASIILAELYIRRGEPEKADIYYRRAEQCGEEPYVSKAKEYFAGGPQATEDSYSKSIKISYSTKFCTGCGTEFVTVEQNFCGNCGNKRA